MGTRKELLVLPDGTPLFIRMISLLHNTKPFPHLHQDTHAPHVYISLRDQDKLNALCTHHTVTKIDSHNFTLNLQGREPPILVRVLYDVDLAHSKNLEIGPAGGLLRAYQDDPEASWMVVACDYPFMGEEGLAQLWGAFNGDLTVFYNADGFSEPLLGVWTPVALRELSRAVAEGITSPNYIVRRLKSELVRPKVEKWLMNANTPEEWGEVLRGG